MTQGGEALLQNARYAREQAARMRRLITMVPTPDLRKDLERIAAEFEAEAIAWEEQAASQN